MRKVDKIGQNIFLQIILSVVLLKYPYIFFFFLTQYAKKSSLFIWFKLYHQSRLLLFWNIEDMDYKSFFEIVSCFDLSSFYLFHNFSFSIHKQ